MDNPERMILQIEGMTCVGCETRIENKLRKAKGILSVKASYANGTARITFDNELIALHEIKRIIESIDYKVIRPKSVASGKIKSLSDKLYELIMIALVMVAIYSILRSTGLLNILNVFPEVKQGMSYGVLFVIGILTSLHCVAMCGGINLSQCVPQSVNPDPTNKTTNLMPSILYNSGRVVSYTLIGAIVGALGSLISFSGQAKGLVAIVASIFMVIMGINMLNLFPWMRKFNPRLPKIFARKINSEKQGVNTRPFYVGLLNGLMPCGPLQAMQLYALSTGDPIKGGLSMLFFSLGTVPLMFGLGAISSMLSKKFTHKMMKVSAVLVIVLGFVMFQTGLSVSGIALPSILDIIGLADKSTANKAIVSDGVQTITTELHSGSYESITVQAGIPVKWNIHAGPGTRNGCNYRIIIQTLGIQIQLEEGDNIIKFTPEKAQTINFNCWMGMIRGRIKVLPI